MQNVNNFFCSIDHALREGADHFVRKLSGSPSKYTVVQPATQTSYQETHVTLTPNNLADKVLELANNHLRLESTSSKVQAKDISSNKERMLGTVQSELAQKLNSVSVPVLQEVVTLPSEEATLEEQPLTETEASLARGLTWAGRGLAILTPGLLFDYGWRFLSDLPSMNYIGTSIALAAAVGIGFYKAVASETTEPSETPPTGEPRPRSLPGRQVTPIFNGTTIGEILEIVDTESGKRSKAFTLVGREAFAVALGELNTDNYGEFPSPIKDLPLSHELKLAIASTFAGGTPDSIGAKKLEITLAEDALEKARSSTASQADLFQLEIELFAKQLELASLEGNAFGVAEYKGRIALAEYELNSGSVDGFEDSYEYAQLEVERHKDALNQTFTAHGSGSVELLAAEASLKGAEWVMTNKDPNATSDMKKLAHLHFLETRQKHAVATDPQDFETANDLEMQIAEIRYLLAPSDAAEYAFADSEECKRALATCLERRMQLTELAQRLANQSIEHPLSPVEVQKFLVEVAERRLLAASSDEEKLALQLNLLDAKIEYAKLRHAPNTVIALISEKVRYGYSRERSEVDIWEYRAQLALKHFGSNSTQYREAEIELAKKKVAEEASKEEPNATTLYALKSDALEKEKAWALKNRDIERACELNTQLYRLNYEQNTENLEALFEDSDLFQQLSEENKQLRNEHSSLSGQLAELLASKGVNSPEQLLKLLTEATRTREIAAAAGSTSTSQGPRALNSLSPRSEQEHQLRLTHLAAQQVLAQTTGNHALAEDSMMAIAKEKYHFCFQNKVPSHEFEESPEYYKALVQIYSDQQNRLFSDRYPDHLSVLSISAELESARYQLLALNGESTALQRQKVQLLEAQKELAEAQGHTAEAAPFAFYAACLRLQLVETDEAEKLIDASKKAVEALENVVKCESEIDEELLAQANALEKSIQDMQQGWTREQKRETAPLLASLGELIVSPETIGRSGSSFSGSDNGSTSNASLGRGESEKPEATEDILAQLKEANQSRQERAADSASSSSDPTATAGNNKTTDPWTEPPPEAAPVSAVVESSEATTSSTSAQSGGSSSRSAPASHGSTVGGQPLRPRPVQPSPGASRASGSGEGSA